MEYFRTPSQTFSEASGSCRHDHELLYIHRVRRMSSAVQNIHHRDRKPVAVHTAQETVQRDVLGRRRSPGAGDRHRKDRIGTEIRLVFRPVRFDHRSVHCINIGSVHAAESVIDHSVDILHSFRDTLASVSALVAVSQLQSLELACRCAAGRRSPCRCSIRQINLRLHGRISSGIDDLPSDHFLNF